MNALMHRSSLVCALVGHSMTYVAEMAQGVSDEVVLEMANAGV